MKVREAIGGVASALGKLLIVSVEVDPTPEALRAAKAVDARIQGFADSLGEGDLAGVVDNLRGMAIDIAQAWSLEEKDR